MTGRMLVTGGAGFIGSHVTEALVSAGYAVRVLDSFATGSRSNLTGVAGDLEIVTGDIRDPECLREACAGIETVFHLAAFISAPGSVADPASADAVNIAGTLNVLTAARDAGVRRLVFSSSAAVYGEPEQVPTPETARTRPASPYGLEKLYGEHMCRLFTELYGLETVALRYFNVFGPRQHPTSEYAAVIPKFVSALLSGTKPTIYGDGLQTRDFLFVEDVARANLLAAESPDAVGLAINIASGRAVSVLDMLAEVSSQRGVSVEPLHAAPREGDIRHSVADVSLAERVLGFRSTVSLAEGLRRTVAWLRRTGG